MSDKERVLARWPDAVETKNRVDYRDRYLICTGFGQDQILGMSYFTFDAAWADAARNLGRK